MMHRGAAEHYIGQQLLFSDYIVENWRRISRELASLGMHVVFTGHHHADQHQE